MPVHLHLIFGCFYVLNGRVVAIETAWPTKPQIFTVYSLTKKVYLSQPWGTVLERKFTHPKAQ